MMKKSRGIIASLFFTSLLFVLILPNSGCDNNKTIPLKVLYWNDFHAANSPVAFPIENGDTIQVGGIAQLASIVQQVRSNHKYVLVLDGGDDFQGSPISSLTQGASQIELLNVILPDAMILGNHEFDYGPEILHQRLAEAEFPILLSNIRIRTNGNPVSIPDTILNIEGIDVGLIGVMAGYFDNLLTQQVASHFEVLSADSMIQVSLERFKQAAVDVRIVLSHSGFEQDSLLATKFGNKIDVIVGAHSHSLLREGRRINGVLITQAGSRGQWYGELDIEVDTLNHRVTDSQTHVKRILASDLPADTAIQELLDRQETLLSEKLDVEVATLVTPWIRSEDGESNIGNWVAETYRHAAKADVGIINSSAIWTNFPAGPLTIRDIYAITPFNNQLVKLEVTGEELIQIIRHSLADHSRSMQISGLRYIVQRNSIRATVNGQDIVPEQLYSIGTIIYVTDHIDWYFGFTPGDHEIVNLSLIDQDVLLEAALRQEMINSTVDDRQLILP